MERQAPGDAMRVPYWLRGCSCLWAPYGGRHALSAGYALCGTGSAGRSTL